MVIKTIIPNNVNFKRMLHSRSFYSKRQFCKPLRKNANFTANANFVNHYGKNKMTTQTTFGKKDFYECHSKLLASNSMKRATKT